MPISSTHVELNRSGMPSTGPTPQTRIFPFPRISHPKDANSVSWSNDPSLPDQSLQLLIIHSRKVLSPPGMNLTCWSKHCENSGSVSMYSSKLCGSTASSTSSWITWSQNMAQSFVPSLKSIVAGTTVSQPTVSKDSYWDADGMGTVSMWCWDCEQLYVEWTVSPYCQLSLCSYWLCVIESLPNLAQCACPFPKWLMKSLASWCVCSLNCLLP